MIPLLSAEDFYANPDFARVWEYIMTRLLEPDGSSRRENEARPRGWEASGKHRSESHRLSTTLADEDIAYEGYSFFSENSETRSRRDEAKEKPSCEDLLQEVRVRRMKRRILREVLAEVPYLPDDMKATALTEKNRRIPLASSPDTLPKFTTTEPVYDTSKDGQSTEVESIQEQRQSLASLRDLILLMSAYVDACCDASFAKAVTDDERELLSEDIQHFTANIPAVADAMSAHLIDLEASLRVLSNSALESHEDDHRPPSPTTLSESIELQQTDLSRLRASLSPSLTTLQRTLHQFLTVQNTLLLNLLRHIEISKHGIPSRHAVSKVAFLDTVAQTMALKTEVLVLEARLRAAAGPEAEERRETARREMEMMEAEDRRLDARASVLEGVWEEYEAVDPGGTVMKTLGRRYAEIEAEMEGVRGDIEKLERTS